MGFTNRPDYRSPREPSAAPVRRAGYADRPGYIPIPPEDPADAFPGFKTYSGIALMLLPTVLGWFGIDIAKEELGQIIMGIGAVLSAYGRWKAGRRA